MITHQRGENLVRCHHVFDLHLQQTTSLRIHGGFPELIGIHLPEPLIALYRLTPARLIEQPADGIRKAHYGALPFPPTHPGPVLDQSFELGPKSL